MIYTWNFSNIVVIENETQPQIVESFNWELIGEYDNMTSSYTKKMSLVSSNNIIENFIDFPLLTKDYFIKRVTVALGNELGLVKKAIEKQVQIKIREANNVIVSEHWVEATE